jgi:hypothetical protein
MTVDSLLSDAFSLGTGVSRRTALASTRYEELVASFPRVPHLTTEQTAEMALLGEMLAERAFRTIPFALRNKATKWNTFSEDEQVALLHELKETLGDKSLGLRRSTRGTKLEHPEHRALPHQYKSWTRNPARASCLGLAQMLIGFAKTTGAPCLLVDVLVPHHIHVAQFQYVRLQRLAKLLDEYAPHEPRFNRFRRIIQSTIESTLDILVAEQEGQQAHHALAIKTASHWWIVDPYFDTIKRLHGNPATIDRVHNNLQKAPRGSATENNAKTYQQAIVDHRLKVLDESLPYLRRLHEPRSSWTHVKASMTALFDTNVIYKHLKTEEGDAQYTEAMGTGIVMTMCTSRLLISLTQKYPEAEIQTLIGLCRQRAAQNKRYRNQAHLRTMHLLVRECLIDIVRLSSERAIAKKQEFTHPTFQLAVRTINQLAHERSIDVPELSLYSTGQWILHDTLDAVRRSSSKRLQRVTTDRLNRFGKNPEYALPELSHLLESA